MVKVGKSFGGQDVALHDRELDFDLVQPAAWPECVDGHQRGLGTTPSGIAFGAACAGPLAITQSRGAPTRTLRKVALNGTNARVRVIADQTKSCERYDGFALRWPEFEILVVP